VAGATVSSLPLRIFAPILAVQFIGTLSYSVAIPFLVFVVSDLGGAAWTYGLVGATYSACQLVGAPVLGGWSDRVGRRAILVLSQAGTLAAWLLFLAALALPKTALVGYAGATLTVPLLVVFASRALDGLTGGNISVANAYVADMTAGKPDRRQTAFGKMGMAASLGFALGPALAGLVGDTSWGHAAPVALAATIAALATGLCLLLPAPQSPCPDGPPTQPTVTRILGQQHKRCDRKVPSARRRVLKEPGVVPLIVATFFQFLAFNLFYVGFPVFATQSLAWDVSRIGIFFTVLAGTMIIAQGPLLQALSSRAQPSHLFALGMAALATSFGCLATGHSVLVFLGALLFATGNGIAWPTFQSRVAEAVRAEDQGALQGAVTSTGSAASILGMVAGGVFYASLEAHLFTAGALMFVAVALGTPLWFHGPVQRSGPHVSA